MRDGISKPELDKVVADLVAGKDWDEAAKALEGVDPKVIALNKASILKLAATEKGERHVPPTPVKGEAPAPEKKPEPAKKKDDDLLK
jgi:hypothetical protein